MSNNKETANQFYARAMRDGCYLDATCVGISQYKWDELMKGAVRADKKKVLKAIGEVEEYHNRLLKVALSKRQEVKDIVY